jgi:hypothetical protein
MARLTAAKDQPISLERANDCYLRPTEPIHCNSPLPRKNFKG